MDSLILQNNVLVVGAGSIGERYIRNLWHLGFQNIFVLRRKLDYNFRNIGDAKVQVITDWNSLKDTEFYASFICTPTSKHVTQAYELINLGIHTLVEKPLSNSTDGILELKNLIKSKNNIYLQVGYMMRYHPQVVELKKYIDDKIFGDVISIQTKWGEYLPNWHPWEDYSISYAARKDLGGGAALTLSHDIDLVNWLMDCKVLTWKTQKNYSSKLNLDVESGVDILIKFKKGQSANIQLNFHEIITERYIKVIFDKAVVDINFVSNEIKIHTNEGITIKKDTIYQRNDLFISELKTFFDSINMLDEIDLMKNIIDSELIIKICNE